METIEVRGLSLAYRSRGDGPPVVFVHGGASDGRSWTPQLEALSDEFTTIAWDEPGAGGSGDVPDDFTLADYADCLADLIRALGASPAVVVGLSWGTTVILELYRRHSDVVRGLVLADGYAGWKGSLGAEEADARLASLAAGTGGGSGPIVPGLFAGPPPTPFVPLLAAMDADAGRRSRSTSLVAMARADLTDVLPTIAVPTLLIWGELDVRSPVAVAREFERAIPGARLVLVPHCGHASNLEAPDTFTGLVRDFLRGLTRGSEGGTAPPEVG